MQNKLLSLCIPTNGIVEWVLPVLESIYATSNIPEALYEVIITDNGDNTQFAEEIYKFSHDHENLVYKQTRAKGFLNQIESFKMANGLFIKFINHRSLFNKGTLQYLLTFVAEHEKKRPITYFMNGSLLQAGINIYDSFDGFVRGLSYYSSWSGGLACWKQDFDNLVVPNGFNALFPHTDILFSITTGRKYVIDHTKLFTEIISGHGNKGTYNLFQAFAFEYLLILSKLLGDNYITLETFNFIKKSNKRFICDLYLHFIILREKCSYNLENYREWIGIFYSYKDILVESILYIPFKIFKKIL